MTLEGFTGPGDTVGESPRLWIEDSGTGSFMFSGADAVRDHPIRVRYIAPDGDLSTADILFVMTVAARDAQDYRTDWEPLVRSRHVLVIIPTFDQADYPVDAYNLGKLVGPDGDANLRDTWSFTVIDALFDSVVAHNHSHAKDFMMFGHSAGAQFVHRFIEFTPNRVRTAVVANAGWYTMPDDSKVFPYGLRGVPQDEEGLADSYSATSRSSSVRTTSTPMTDCCGTTPGVTRRGPIDSNADLSFYLTARKSAEEHSLTFRWHLRVVPGIVHDHTAMARAAAPILFGRSE